MRLLLRCEIANLMQFFVGLYAVLLILFSVVGFNKGFFKFPLGGLVLMDYVACLKHLNQDCELRCGYFLFGNFKQVYKFLGLFLLFRIGFKLLSSGRFSRVLIPFLCDLGQSGRLDYGFCSKNGKLRLWKFSEEREKSNNSYTASDGKLKSDSDEEYFTDDDERECTEEGGVSTFRKLLRIEPHRVNASASAAEEEEDRGKSNSSYPSSDGKLMTESDEVFFTARNDNDERECTEEDDVSALRKLLEIEQHKVSAARAELERERAASASAAEEAMAMILRLQNEKSLVEMELNQFRRLAEEKQIHDQEVIRSLQWLVWQHESGGREEEVEMCRKKDEAEEFEPFNGSIMDALENVLYSSRE